VKRKRRKEHGWGGGSSKRGVKPLNHDGNVTGECSKKRGFTGTWILEKEGGWGKGFSLRRPHSKKSGEYKSMMLTETKSLLGGP